MKLLKWMNMNGVIYINDANWIWLVVYVIRYIVTCIYDCIISLWHANELTKLTFLWIAYESIQCQRITMLYQYVSIA